MLTFISYFPLCNHIANPYNMFARKAKLGQKIPSAFLTKSERILLYFLFVR